MPAATTGTSSPPFKPLSTAAINEIIRKAKVAEGEFAKLNQEEVDRIFLKISHEADKMRVPLALMAVKDTGMGLVEDKVLKNGLACELIRDQYKDLKTVGVIERDTVHGITKIAQPVGTVVCITPTTNPTSTAIAKSLFLAKTRNTGIFLPHPRAAACTADAVRICHEAGVAAGAPENFIQCITEPTMATSEAIMKHPDVNLILATGGPGMVKASYKTGHPAIGVGSGNAPVLVDETANLVEACGYIVVGKTFDNGMICAAEQSVVVVDEVYDSFKSLLCERGVHFLYGEEKKALENFLIQNGRVNADIVGQSAKTIAERIGVDVPAGTVVLAAEETGVGPEFAMSHEKLSPVLAMYRASDFEGAVQLCKELTTFGGVGHTAGIYSGDSGRIEKYSEEIPAGRILSNMPASVSAIGSAFNHNLGPSFTLGVGAHAGSSASENVGPMHLLDVKTVATRQEHIEWYKNPPNVYFRYGCLEEALSDCAKQFADGTRLKRCLMVTDKVMSILGFVDRVRNRLQAEGFSVSVFDDVEPDPGMATIRKGVMACETFKPDLMVCLGGGSPMDAGKYIRLKYECPDLSIEDAAARFLELRKRTSPFPTLGSKIHKLICIPTTSGTASEVTPFSVITDDEGMKHPIFSYRLTPDMAIIDSSFCDNLPKGMVALPGIDAITHAVEAYVSVAANSFTQSHSLEALKLLFDNLEESYSMGTKKSREGVHHGASIAGLAFSNSFLGIDHSLSHKIGATFHLPHGMCCGIVLPHVIRFNASKNPTRMGIYPGYDHPMALERYTQIAKHLGLSGTTDEELMEAFIDRIESLMTSMNVPLTLKAAGVDEKAFLDNVDEMALQAFDDQCTATNPRFPLIEELKGLLKLAYYGAETVIASKVETEVVEGVVVQGDVEADAVTVNAESIEPEMVASSLSLSCVYQAAVKQSKMPMYLQNNW